MAYHLPLGNAEKAVNANYILTPTVEENIRLIARVISLRWVVMVFSHF